MQSNSRPPDVTSAPAESVYKSVARRVSLPWHVREREDLTGRDDRGRFVPKYSPDGLCDWIGCEDKPEAKGRRFCVDHRRAHALRLLAQLREAVGDTPGRAMRRAKPGPAPAPSGLIDFEVIEDEPVGPRGAQWVDHILCDYPVTGYHARRGGVLLCGWSGGESTGGAR